MKFFPTAIPDVIIIESKIYFDSRGYFMESYKEDLFAQNGINEKFVQDNTSYSVQGTLRGLHYQIAPFSQGKLVRVFRGSVFDVAVDIRRGSPYFGQWVGKELSEENKLAMYIPPGFAHGFFVLSETAEFTYKCTNVYTPEAERGIIWNDPQINIYWPIQNMELIISEKDKQNPELKDADYNFFYDV